MAIRRISPITIALLVLAVVIAAAAAYLISRPRQARSPVVAGETEDPTTAATRPLPSLAGDSVGQAKTPPSRDRLSAPSTAPPAIAEADAPDPARSDAGAGDRTDAAKPAGSRKETLVVNHLQRLQEADEQLFERMKLPDATRDAIREITRDYVKRTVALAAVPSPNGAGDAGAGDAETAAVAAAANARRDAIRNLLGADAAKTFDTAERVGVMRLRGKYRREWGKTQGF